jgi:sentrin-specific protease 8
VFLSARRPSPARPRQVNNNPFVDVAEGGSHWSLLVLERQRSGGEFWHVDSMGDTNEAAAKQLAATLASGLDLRAVASDDDGATCSFHAARVPQQRNGFDCGVHVLAAAAAVADAAAAVHSLAELEAALRTITPDAVTALRGSCLQLIERLSEED